MSEKSPVKKEPFRTCLACRAKKAKQGLYRMVAVNGEVVFDEKQQLPGRGAYCCKTKTCLKRLFKNEKKIVKAFRCKKLIVSAFDSPL
ncbi:MAG: YlxR family protein [Desulfobulbaceae bacterium]|nr:YlxR family protein [Desulfobulbaceae bacterium]